LFPLSVKKQVIGFSFFFFVSLLREENNVAEHFETVH
jgi:hypothetical protein